MSVDSFDEAAARELATQVWRLTNGLAADSKVSPGIEEQEYAEEAVRFLVGRLAGGDLSTLILGARDDLAWAVAENKRLTAEVKALTAARDAAVGEVERLRGQLVFWDPDRVELAALRAVRDAAAGLLAALPRCNDGDCQGVRTWEGFVGRINYYACDRHGGPGTYATGELSYAAEIRALAAALAATPPGAAKGEGE